MGVVHPQTRASAVVVDEPPVTRADLDHVRSLRLPPDGDVELRVQMSSSDISYSSLGPPLEGGYLLIPASAGSLRPDIRASLSK
jgi:hypothetical protein